MASAIRWLDQSASEQKRVQELVRLFQQPESRDELGIGQIRDVFSNVLFPGTSVLLTRARYFLIVPWFFQSAPVKLAGAALRDWVERRERWLIAQLRDDGIVDGLIGSRAGPNVKLLASSIYWNGLKQWQIVLGEADIDRLIGRAGSLADGVDELAARSVGDWTPDMPPTPPGFPATLSGGFDLTDDEAVWLRDQIVRTVPNSLIANLVMADEPLVPLGPGTPGPWDEPLTETLTDPDLRQWLHDARRFSFCMNGAALLYNLLLIDRYHAEGFNAVATPEAEYQRRVQEWHRALLSQRDEIADWDRSELRRRVMRRNPRITPATWTFVNAWIDEALASPDLTASVSARGLIADRERRLKGRQARLTNLRLLQTWQGESAAGALTYRWSNVHRLVTDIQRGRGIGDAAA